MKAGILGYVLLLVTGCAWLKANAPKIALDVGQLGSCVITHYETDNDYAPCIALAAQMGVTLTAADVVAITSVHKTAKASAEAERASHLDAGPMGSPR